MSKARWSATKELVGLFRAVGRTLLLNDMEDSHSGNIAMLWTNEQDEEYLVITSTGSQKGDLDAGQICFLSTTDTDYGYYKASSETDIHARILSLPNARASIHAHTKDLTIMTYDDADKPNQPEAFIPIDPLGYYHLGGEIPVDWVAVPSGSAEMTRIIPDRLAIHAATVIQGHGTFVRAENLHEALFRVCLANNSGYTARLAARVGIDLAELRAKIAQDPDAYFAYPPSAYAAFGYEPTAFSGEEEIKGEFMKTGARIFESHISPFHTGSMSVRGVQTILYAPKASMPRELGGPLLEIPLDKNESGDRELSLHQQIYSRSQFQTILHCYVPEAEVMARYIPPGETKPLERMIAIDAEGSFMYLVVPILPEKHDFETFLKLLHDYKVVIVRGGGVWGVGAQSLSEVLHHPSSVREICWYRFGVLERGLDISKLEPKQSKNW
jgi:ribulose-5-phosphate 4-epimerase/fuculose-1-phosphate aldolase